MKSEDVIVCCGVGQWYPRGVDRLGRSLNYHGWGGDTILWRNEYPPGCPTHQQVPYAFKLAAIEHAGNVLGYNRILWVDSSVWCVADPLPIFHRIATDGYYLWDSIFAVGTWTNDRCLSSFGMSRDEAMAVPMLSANVIGLHWQNGTAREFMRQWREAMDRGDFAGSWIRQEGDAEDERYQGHRHDQSAASIIAHRLGMSLDAPGNLCQYYAPTMPDTVVLTLRGM